MTASYERNLCHCRICEKHLVIKKYLNVFHLFRRKTNYRPVMCTLILILSFYSLVLNGCCANKAKANRG